MSSTYKNPFLEPPKIPEHLLNVSIDYSEDELNFLSIPQPNQNKTTTTINNNRIINNITINNNINFNTSNNSNNNKDEPSPTRNRSNRVPFFNNNINNNDIIDLDKIIIVNSKINNNNNNSSNNNIKNNYGSNDIIFVNKKATNVIILDDSDTEDESDSSTKENNCVDYKTEENTFNINYSSNSNSNNNNSNNNKFIYNILDDDDEDDDDDVTILPNKSSNNRNDNINNDNSIKKRKHQEIEENHQSLDSDITEIDSSQKEYLTEDDIQIMNNIESRIITTTTTTTSNQNNNNNNSNNSNIDLNNSNKTTPTSSAIPEVIEETQVDCIICFTEVSSFETHKVEGNCDHILCRDCFQQYLIGKINDKEYPIKCPGFKCDKEVSIRDLDILLDEEIVNKYQEYSFQKTIEVNPDIFSFCPTADCGYIFFWEKGDSVDFQCPKCKNRYCFKCRVDFHVNLTCEQYQIWAKENGMGDQLFDEFVSKQNYKKCPKCQRWVEKTHGCNHIVCKCGHKFCYHCGQSYPCTCGFDPHTRHYNQHLQQPQILPRVQNAIQHHQVPLNQNHLQVIQQQQLIGPFQLPFPQLPIIQYQQYHPVVQPQTKTKFHQQLPRPVKPHPGIPIIPPPPIFNNKPAPLIINQQQQQQQQQNQQQNQQTSKRHRRKK